MIQDKKLLKTIIYFTVLNTFIITPFFNKDAMIIPKLMVLATLTMYLLPIILSNRELIFASLPLKAAVLIQTLILIQSIIVMIMSSSPIEQQIFGRTGRGLGFITVLSLAVIFISVSICVEDNSKSFIVVGLLLSSFASSLYAILQSFGIDLLAWDSKTNGVIGTLGNPNFQSAFVAMALVPSFLYYWVEIKKFHLAKFLVVFLLYALYRIESTQGFIAGSFAAIIVLLIYLWYKSRLLFFFSSIVSILIGLFVFFGMLNYGPLSGYLYKISIQSRGDFWRAAFNTANSHPLYGVGLDSFGDYSLMYRDLIAANHIFAEYTDNAHNFFLEYAATGGYPLAIFNFAIVVLVLLSFFKIQRLKNKFDPITASLFSAWLAFQMTTVISPGNLVNMTWNAVISGGIVGLAKTSQNKKTLNEDSNKISIRYNQWASLTASMVGFLFVLPLFNVDRMQFAGMQKGDARMVMAATLKYPESTVRYSLIGGELLKSGLNQQSLELAQAGVKFNKNSAALWALILANPIAPLEERLNAKNIILKLDPLNTEVKKFTP
jgi:O-antigen ligase